MAASSLIEAEAASLKADVKSRTPITKCADLLAGVMRVMVARMMVMVVMMAGERWN